MWFRVPHAESSVRTSAGRVFTLPRPRLWVRVWSAGRRSPVALPAFWDTGADFVTLSEVVATRLGCQPAGPAETITTTGIGGSVAGTLFRLAFQLDQLDPLRGINFLADCVILAGSTFPVPLLGNHFVRRNFDIETRGERRTYFRLRDPAPDAVLVGQLGGP
jgi:hypothetical protein